MKYFNKDFSLITGHRFLLRNIIKFIKNIDNYAPKKGALLLDIGCGSMPYKKIFEKYSYLGMDNLSEKQAKPEIIGNIEKIPLKKNSVDAVMTNWVLDDVYNLDEAISEISRVLKKNGYYFAVENQSAQIHNPPYDYFRMAPNAMKKLCSKNGLKLIEYDSFAGDFGNVGFSLILICRQMLGRFLRPVYSLFFNLIFSPLDKIFRKKININSLGYCYIFKKINGQDINLKSSINLFE